MRFRAKVKNPPSEKPSCDFNLRQTQAKYVHTCTHSWVPGPYDFHMPWVLLFFFSPLRLKDPPLHTHTHTPAKKKKAVAVPRLWNFTLTAGFIFIEQRKIIPGWNTSSVTEKCRQMCYRSRAVVTGRPVGKWVSESSLLQRYCMFWARWEGFYSDSSKEIVFLYNHITLCFVSKRGLD